MAAHTSRAIIHLQNIHVRWLAFFFGRGSWKLKDELLVCGSFRLPNGNLIRFRDDSWLGDKPFKNIYPTLRRIVTKKDDTVANVLLGLIQLYHKPRRWRALKGNLLQPPWVKVQTNMCLEEGWGTYRTPSCSYTPFHMFIYINIVLPGISTHPQNWTALAEKFMQGRRVARLVAVQTKGLQNFL